MARAASYIIPEARKTLTGMIEYVRYVEGLLRENPGHIHPSLLCGDAGCVKRAKAAIRECKRWEDDDAT